MKLTVTQMSPSAGGTVPSHRLPYETELGDAVSLEQLIQFVFKMQERPSIPKQWERLPQVFLNVRFTC